MFRCVKFECKMFELVGFDFYVFYFHNDFIPNSSFIWLNEQF